MGNELNQLEELKRKSEQGSQQAQGEAFALELEKTLASRFPTDTITPVGKGIRGGDILHDVQTANGKVAGRIFCIEILRPISPRKTPSFGVIARN